MQHWFGYCNAAVGEALYDLSLPTPSGGEDLPALGGGSGVEGPRKARLASSSHSTRNDLNPDFAPSPRDFHSPG